MQSYTPGKPAAVTFALVDGDGNALAPTALRARILDENEVLLQDWTDQTVPAVTESEVTVSVLGALNILTPPATRGARVVELEVTTAAGTIVLSQTIMLGGSSALCFGINTVLAYPAAEVLAADFVPLQMAGWHAAPRSEREQALIEAYSRMLRLHLTLRFDDQQSMLTFDGEFDQIFGPMRLEYLTPGQILKLFPPFLKSLKRAQLVEADDILNGDVVRKAREAGLISNTVGESSQFFRSAKPLETAVGKRALEELTYYIKFTARIGRNG